MKIQALTHRVVEGERWDTLAWRYYGDPFGYGRIVEANPAMNIVPVLPAGAVVLIPLLTLAEQAARREASSLPPWKR